MVFAMAPLSGVYQLSPTYVTTKARGISLMAMAARSTSPVLSKDEILDSETTIECLIKIEFVELEGTWI